MLRGPVERPKAEGRVALAGLMVLALVMGLLATTATPTLAGAPASDPDKVAMSNLRNGSLAALTYYHSNSDSFLGFDAAEGEGIKPSLTWADGDAVKRGVVNIGKVTPTGTRVMLETLSGSGTSFCLAFNASNGVTGKDTAGGTFGNYLGCRKAPSGPW